MTFPSDSRTVFVTLQDSGELAAIDLPTQTVQWKMHVGNTPAGLWMTPGDKLSAGRHDRRRRRGRGRLAQAADREEDSDGQAARTTSAILDDGKHVAVSESGGQHDQHHRLQRAHQSRRHHRPHARTRRHGTVGRQALSVGRVPLREARRHHRPEHPQADRHHRGRPLAARHLFRQPRARSWRRIRIEPHRNDCQEDPGERLHRSTMLHSRSTRQRVSAVQTLLYVDVVQPFSSRSA